MPKQIKIEVPDFDFVDFQVKTEEGTRDFKLLYDYAAIKAAEDATGLDLRDLTQWTKIKSQHMPAIVHAGLLRHHPDVTVEQVTKFLHPATQYAIQDAIFELIFPGYIEKFQQEKAKEAERKNAEGDAAESASVPVSA